MNYSTLTEKATCFDAIDIKTSAEFFSFITDMKQKQSKQFIFRGINEAKYKLYNSAQRFWVEYNLEKEGVDYKDLIKAEIENAKSFQNELLKKLYNSFGHIAYDLSILSFLQHYGGVTPLLDFTYNFDYALFFGIDEMENATQNNDIDDFFSIYAINTNQADFPWIGLHLDRETKILNNGLKNLNGIKIDTSNVLDKIQKLEYKTFEEYQLLCLEGYVPNGILYEIPSVPNFKLVYNQHNLNIINQEGVLFFNSDANQPLENFFGTSSSVFRLSKIQCWNIHKSLKTEVDAYLSKNNIDKKFIYPKEKNIAKQAKESIIKQFNIKLK